MKKMLVLTCALALLVGTTTLADHYATKADYKAGKLTPSAPIPKGSGNVCSDPLEDIRPTPTQDWTHTGDTTGSTNTVDTLPLSCNGNYTAAPGPDDIYLFQISGANMLTFEVVPATDAYDPSIYAVSTCGDGNSCGVGAGSDGCWARAAGGNPCGPVSTESFTIGGLSNADYYFYVDSFYMPGNANGRDVGVYDLTVMGFVPVELMEFSVD